MAGDSKVIWNPYTPGYFQNPYPHLAECRETNPIHRGVHGSWVFFRYKDISELLRSDKLDASVLSDYFAEREEYIFKNTNTCPYLAKSTKQWPMYLNGLEHKQVRLAMGKAFNQIPLEKVIIKAVEICNEAFKNADKFDLGNYCAQFIFLVIKDLFGLKNYENLDKIRHYSNSLAKSQDVFIPKQVYAAINEQFLWGASIFSDSKYKSIVKDQFKGKLTDDEIYSIMSISFMAAFETSKDSLSIALIELLKNKELIDGVLNNSEQELNKTIEELLRFSSPLQYTIRVTKETLEVDNVLIEKNSKLFLCLASANRDPRIFGNANSIILNRDPNPHLAFGGGVHFCLGSAIARQEMRLCLKPMLNFLKTYNVNPDISWNRQVFMRTPQNVQLVKQ